MRAARALPKLPVPPLQRATRCTQDPRAQQLDAQPGRDRTLCSQLDQIGHSPLFAQPGRVRIYQI